MKWTLYLLALVVSLALACGQVEDTDQLAAAEAIAIAGTVDASRIKAAVSATLEALENSATPTAIPTPVPIPTPEPTATPTSSPSPTSISRVAPSAVLGSEEWWDEIGPYGDYAENVDIGRSGADYVYWLMYRATFALSEWLGGSEPWLGDFAQFVEDTPFLELRDVSSDLFGQMEFVDENTQQWAKPYLSPETANDMNLLIYVGISACLTVNTLDGCLAALQTVTTSQPSGPSPAIQTAGARAAERLLAIQR